MKKAKDKYFGRDEYQNPVIVYSKKKYYWSGKKSTYKKIFSTYNLW